jgi:serine/threonine protein kinase
VRITSTFQADDGHEYEILSDSLGAGAQGAVRRGRRVADDYPVAIKRLTDGAGRGPEANRELQIALKLHRQDSQHLLVPLTWAIDGADLLLVMPLADHSLAAERADHENGRAEDALLPVLRDVTSGLVELHAAGIVHRDLKPDNVLLYEGRWCLADFGISRDLDVRTATLTFQDHGTAPYVAPERWRAQPATHKSDLLLSGVENEHEAGVDGEHEQDRVNPAGRVPGGVVVLNVSAWCSFCRDLGDGGADGGLVHDGFVRGERGDQRLDGEVVDRPWVTSAGLMDQPDRILAEQRV